jgi:hypothetical protein
MAQGMGKWQIHSESSEILQKTDYFSLIPCFLQKFDFTWQLVFGKLTRVGLSQGILSLNSDRCRIPPNSDQNTIRRPPCWQTNLTSPKQTFKPFWTLRMPMLLKTTGR